MRATRAQARWGRLSIFMISAATTHRACAATTSRTFFERALPPQWRAQGQQQYRPRNFLVMMCWQPRPTLSRLWGSSRCGAVRGRVPRYVAHNPLPSQQRNQGGKLELPPEMPLPVRVCASTADLECAALGRRGNAYEALHWQRSLLHLDTHRPWFGPPAAVQDSRGEISSVDLLRG